MCSSCGGNKRKYLVTYPDGTTEEVPNRGAAIKAVAKIKGARYAPMPAAS